MWSDVKFKFVNLLLCSNEPHVHRSKLMRCLCVVFSLSLAALNRNFLKRGCRGSLRMIIQFKVS